MKKVDMFIVCCVIATLLMVIVKQHRVINQQRVIEEKYYDYEYEGNPYYENPDTIIDGTD